MVWSWSDEYVVVASHVSSDHDWDEGVVTKEPTYTEEGEMTYTCKNCGETKTEPIPKLVPASSGEGAEALIPQTGDSAPVAPLAAAAALAMVIMAGALAVARKQD